MDGDMRVGCLRALDPMVDGFASQSKIHESCFAQQQHNDDMEHE